MGDRWVENFVMEFFVKIGKNAVHCKKYLKSEEICSALHFLLANIRLEI